MKFNLVLETLCSLTTNQVFQYLKARKFKIKNHNGRRYAYRAGKTPNAPMVVCHADTVVNGGNGPHNFKINGTEVESIALDDRLGIAVMMYLIQKTDMADCAFLVCDDEEIGRSTASLFDENAHPNWMVELDRRGTDAVMYDYETSILRSMLEWSGFDIGVGSFSDICYLDHLGVSGFNIGVGYHREHSNACYADITDTFSQIAKLEKFYAKFGDVRLTYNGFGGYGKKAKWKYNDYRSYDSYDSYNGFSFDDQDCLLKDIETIEQCLETGKVTKAVDYIYDKYGFASYQTPEEILEELKLYGGW